MPLNSDYKVFWDAVHGQIKIPALFCKLILDTEHFQRLKRLEQTNARPLYPCAHHDRFVHSLGTYHLGRLTFKSIFKTSEKSIIKYAVSKSNDKPVDWDKLNNEFSLACLLHDVGHAPFSHTFEEFFNVNLEDNSGNILNNLLLNKHRSTTKMYGVKNHLSESRSFKDDYGRVISGKPFEYRKQFYKLGINPKEHEKVSAYLVLKKFQDTIFNSFGSDPFAVARMILGIKYSEAFRNDTESVKFQIYNCFIELLNGEEIDVDKIDYNIRDQWATGNVFRHIDCSRLLGSIYILEDNETGLLQNFFHKKSINEIIALKETKHSIAINTHSHPIVKYDDHLLKKAVNEVIRIESKDCPDPLSGNPSLMEENKENFISKIVSVDALLKPVNFCNSKVYLPTDDDLVHYLKKNFLDSPCAREWLSRDYRLKSLWKSPFDFNYRFSSLKSFERKVLFKEIENITDKFLVGCIYLNHHQGSEPFYVQKKGLQDYKVFKFESNIRILLNKESAESSRLSALISGEKIVPTDYSEADSTSTTNTYFILYLPTPFEDKRFNENKNKERLKFFEFAIREVDTYIKSLKNDIFINLKKNPGITPAILTGLLSLFDSCKSAEDKMELEETVKLFLIHLVNLKEIECDNYNINPRKRKYSLPVLTCVEVPVSRASFAGN